MKNQGQSGVGDQLQIKAAAMGQQRCQASGTQDGGIGRQALNQAARLIDAGSQVKEHREQAEDEGCHTSLQ